jgi:cell division septation protein DedD
VAARQPAPRCRAWGPFEEVRQAEEVARRLELAADRFEVFESRSEQSAGYLVFVPTRGPRDVARRLVAALADRRIDSYVLGDGPDSRVAVGVFSDRDRAGRQQRRLAELGYQAGVEPLLRARPVYHLLARLPAEWPVPEDAKSCSDIAPIQQFL